MRRVAIARPVIPPEPGAHRVCPRRVEVDDVGPLDRDQSPQPQRCNEIDVAANRERPQRRVRRGHDRGERGRGGCGENRLVAADRQVADQSRHLPLPAAKGGFWIDVEDLQTTLSVASTAGFPLRVVG